jgi:hypothetical protein
VEDTTVPDSVVCSGHTTSSHHTTAT